MNHLDLTVGGNEFTRLRALVDLPGIRTNVDDVALVNIDDAIRRAADRHGVGGNEVLTVADTHDHGRARRAAMTPVGLVGGDHGNGIAPRRRVTAVMTALSRSPSSLSLMRCATTSVSVWLVNS